MNIRADLHIHSCLSPCGSLEMSPRRIVEAALRKGLNLIALTDHNSALNCKTAELITRQYRTGSRTSRPPRPAAPFYCLSGLEITTVEEIHVLALFPDAEHALAFGEIIYSALADIRVDPDRFGDQVYVDEHDMIIGKVHRYLGNATSFSLDRAVSLITENGGLCIPAHIDRPLFGAVSQLGFLPELPYHGVEVISLPPPAMAKKYPVLQNSDAHRPEDIGRRGFSYVCNEEDFRGDPFTTLKEGLNSVTLCI